MAITSDVKCLIQKSAVEFFKDLQPDSTWERLIMKLLLTSNMHFRISPRLLFAIFTKKNYLQLTLPLSKAAD